MSKLLRLGTTAGLLAIPAFFYYRDARASAHEHLLAPLLRRTMGPEAAHNFCISLMRYPFLCPALPKNWLARVDPEGRLRVKLFEHTANPKVRTLVVDTPIGLAAGLDKQGEAIDSLFQLGFSWVEVGSVTPLPQPGNPKPRVFRLDADRAIINRYGFNSDGHAEVLARLKLREAKGARPTPGRVLAVNLGKNKLGDEVADYVQGVRCFGAHADVLVINVSSPNTPGLRKLQEKDRLSKLLTQVVRERDALPLDSLPPLLVKIAPDLEPDQVSAMARAITEAKVDGVIVGNTTVSRPAHLKCAALAAETGGLSGPPVKPLELTVLRQLRAEVGPDLTLIGCGGIWDGPDALEYMRSGADLVQLYTSFVYRGAGLPAIITKELLDSSATK